MFFCFFFELLDVYFFFFFFQAEDGIRDHCVTGVQTCALPISGPQSPRRWLLKRCASGGGHGVREWRDGMMIPPGSYFQELIDGAPCSIVFVASGERAV